jgi:hypothetical protein
MSDDSLFSDDEGDIIIMEINLEHGKKPTFSSNVMMSHRFKLEMDTAQCVICLEMMKRNQEIETLKCTHVFHHACIKQWHEKKDTCPKCIR